MIIKLSELIALREMPKICSDIPQDQKNKLMNALKTKISQDPGFGEIDIISLGDNYFIYSGQLHYIMDRWGAIIKRVNNDGDIEIIIGSTFTRGNYLMNTPLNMESYQVLLTNKFSNEINKAASKLYINLCKKWKCAIFSDKRVTNDGKHIWYELLTRPNIESTDEVNIFIYDRNKRQIIDINDIEYGNIDDLFNLDDKFEQILIGMKPV